MNIAPGQAVTVAVTVGGNTYTVTGNQAASYPNISNPQAGTSWYANASNNFLWTGTLSGSSSAYVLGIVDSSLNLLWPSSSSFRVVSSSTNSYAINAYTLPTGNTIAMVGAAQTFTIPNAATNSALIIEGFNTVALNVAASPPATLVSVAVNPTTVSLPRGSTKQLTATGTYSNASTADITSQVNWTSSDPATVSVSSSGLATGVGNGLNTVTVTATSGALSASSAINIFHATTSPATPLGQTVTSQIDYGHSGRVTFSSAPSFPANPTWSIPLSGISLYPLIAGGRVFVSVWPANSTTNSSLYAFDASTGNTLWGPVQVPNTANQRLSASYDNGKLFVVSKDGNMRSFDAATGASGWSTTLPGQYDFESAPVAVNGVVYLSGAGMGGMLFAIDEYSGAVLWKANTDYGNVSPTVSGDGVFLASQCLSYKFDLLTGAPLWTKSLNACSGVGQTAAYANGQLFLYDLYSNRSVVLDASQGTVIGNYPAQSTTPALTQTGIFLVNGGTLSAVDRTSRNVLWTFAGDGQIYHSPLVINNVVVAASTLGIIYALDATTGALIWTGTAAPTGSTSSGLVGGGTMGAGEGYLIVPTAYQLTAWRLY